MKEREKAEEKERESKQKRRQTEGIGWRKGEMEIPSESSKRGSGRKEEGADGKGEAGRAAPEATVFSCLFLCGFLSNTQLELNPV